MDSKENGSERKEGSSSNTRLIESIPAGEALDRARRNRLRRYPSPASGGNRLYPLASPTASPTFQIAPNDTIFAIGSCFARNIEKALQDAGKRVLSREFTLGEIGDALGQEANFFNKYSIHSILNEIRWALDRDSFPGKEIVYKLDDERYCDLQLGIAKLEYPIEKIIEFRHSYLDAMAQVVDADVIILTLGYVETWYDTKLRLYLNVSPPAPLLVKEPSRFEFRVLGYEEVLSSLEEFHSLISAIRTKPLKLLVTVSPVPLASTFRDMDVLVANTYSKAVQRAALDEFVRGKVGVDYFPSYEFVTLSNPTVAWSRGDYRHVSPDVVARIMSNVLVSYTGGETVGLERREPEGITSQSLLSSARMMLKLEDYESLLALVASNRAMADRDPVVLMTEANALRRLQKIEECREAIRKAVDVAPDRPVALERLISMCRPLAMRDEALRLVDRHQSAFPARSGFRDGLTWLKD